MKHNLNLPAQLPPLLPGTGRQVYAIEQHSARSRLLKSEQHAAKRRFAAARFPHQAICLPLADFQRNVVDRLDAVHLP